MAKNRKDRILALIHGKGLSKKKIKTIEELLISRNIDVKITQSKNHAHTILKEIDIYDGIITIGGDGTINETVNNINHSKQWLASFPGGTVNCMPRYFKMQTNKGFIQSFLNNNENAKFDLLKAEFISANKKIEKYVLGFITVGHLTNMTVLTEKFRWLPRFLRYPVSGFLNCFTLSKIDADFYSDSEKVNMKKFTSLIINNCASEHFSYIKNWSYSDGKFEYKTEKNNLLTQYLSVINRYFHFCYNNNWKVNNTFLDIKLHIPVTVMADGEIYENITELKIKLIPSVQKVKLPINI